MKGKGDKMKKKLGIWIVLILIAALLFIMLFFTIRKRYIGSYFINHEDNIEKQEQMNQSEERNSKYVSLEQLPKEYTFEQALKDGCFIVSYKTVYNKEKLDEFISNTEMNSSNRISDMIRIVEFTVEGDMIITDIEYTKGGKYRIIHDNTRDQFSTKEDRKITVKEDFPGEIYGIIQTQKEENLTLELALYAIIDYVDPTAKIYQNETICTYPKNVTTYKSGPTFIATVLDVRNKWVLVQPKETKDLGDKVSFGIPNEEKIAIGDKIEITYTGDVMTSYPVQIKAMKIDKIKE